MPTPSHLIDNDLERYLMSQIPDEAELARTDEHMIGCRECVERAEAMADYITAMKEALNKTNAEDESENR